MKLHHVQVSCPPGGEEAARAFYGGALGLVEVDKPPALAARGGAWFRAPDAPDASAAPAASTASAAPAAPAASAAPAAPDGAGSAGGALELHVGVEQDFRPARKAHPALLVADIDAVADRIEAAGFPVEWDPHYPGHRRFYTADGHGNRVEILSPDGPG
ncbi:VOC family protein [Actinopolymorpha sp. B17G11]|uniref:VOC family protein n=1 Tax=Actinopolymorpha sp. B17G11 TaxID=3160861 RepID=UPI0032E4C3E1